MCIKKISLLLILVFLCLTVHAQLLYKVTGIGLEKPSYLFGTHHLAPPSIMDSVPSLSKITNEVDCVVGEIDMSGGLMSMAMKLQPLMMAPQDSTLDKILSHEDYLLLDSIVAAEAGLPIPFLKVMKPAAVQNLILVPMIQKTIPDFSAESQVDMKLQEMVKNNGGEVLGLETVEEQAYALFGAKSICEQAVDLMEFVKSTDTVLSKSVELTDAYMHQDINRMLEFADEFEEDSVALDELLVKRNARWMQKLPSIMAEKSALVAVGAMHLIGEHGILKSLEQLGYTITPIFR